MEIFSQPAFYSALAAFFSLATGIVALYVTYHNSFEATRPELILTGWEREKDRPAEENEHITIGKIENVGKGAALEVRFADEIDGNDKKVCQFQLRYIPVLKAGGSRDINETLTVRWKLAGQSFANGSFRFECWDVRGNRYLTEYQVFVIMNPAVAIFAEGSIHLVRKVHVDSWLKNKLRAFGKKWKEMREEKM